jgi:hypothetical protein
MSKENKEETPKKMKVNIGATEIEATIDKDGHIIMSEEIARELIANPLLTDAEARERLLDYFKRPACEGDEKTARILSVDPDKRVVEVKVINQNIKAPFISLVPIPAMVIDRIDMDFPMNVMDSNTTDDKQANSVDTNISSSKWLDSLTPSRENTHPTTDSKAKYKINISENKSTEGLSKLQDIMANYTDPAPTDTE